MQADRSASPAADTVHWPGYAILAVLLMLAWVLWSGYLKPLLLGFGVFSSILVVYLGYRMRLTETHLLDGRFLLRLARYWGWLVREVVRSSIDVTRIVLDPKLPISPTVAEFETRCTLATDQALVGNSITLTPGTLTIQIADGRFVVHALTAAGARDILAGEMDRRVAALRAD